MTKQKNPAAVALGRLGGRKRVSQGGLAVFSEMGKKSAAKRGVKPREYYQELRRKSGEAKRAKKLSTIDI